MTAHRGRGPLRLVLALLLLWLYWAALAAMTFGAGGW
jgi:hypothetical protein